MADSFLGEIRMFGFNYAPYDWAYCSGTTMDPRQYAALFALLGITYGGDGKTTFKLPNLQGRTITGVGSAPYSLGNTQGAEKITLTTNNIPPHNHNVNSEIQGDLTQVSGVPSAAVLPGRCGNSTGASQKIFTDATTPTVAMGNGMIATNGSGMPHENRQPYLTLNFCISLAGTFPSFD